MSVRRRLRLLRCAAAFNGARASTPPRRPSAGARLTGLLRTIGTWSSPEPSANPSAGLAARRRYSQSQPYPYPYPPPSGVYPPQAHHPQSHDVYPPPSQGPYPPPGYQGYFNQDQRPYYPPPPPQSYGTHDHHNHHHHHHHDDDGSGAGFLRGCLAALCC